MDFNGWEMLVMFSESDLGTLELAYVHAKAIKKKSALEQTFIILYKNLRKVSRYLRSRSVQLGII